MYLGATLLEMQALRKAAENIQIIHIKDLFTLDLPF